MARLLLVRHGQSTWNANGRWQGQADPPLSDLGRLQAQHAAAAIGAVDAVFASTLERARHTAEIIATELGIGPVIELPGLMERHAGVWQGLTRDEIEQGWPGYLADHRRPPGWEDDDALFERARAAVEVIAGQLGDGEAVVVTHGGVINNLERKLSSAFERIANLGGLWVRVEGGRIELGSRLDLLEGAEVTVPDQI